MFLAQSQSFMGVEVSTLVAVATGIGVLYTIWKKVNGELKSQRADIVNDVLAALALQKVAEEKERKKTEQAQQIGPLPLPVELHSLCVKRDSYETHARLNREEHKRIEKDFTEKVSEIEKCHNGLAREVSEINARSEGNETRLIQMDTKLDQLRRDLMQWLTGKKL